MEELKLISLSVLIGFCLCAEISQERLLESGSLLLEEVEAYLDQFTRFKDIENALNEALSGVINFTVVTESAERSTASLADHLRKQLGVVDSLLQELSVKSCLLYEKDSIGCCSKASLGEGHGTCVCDSERVGSVISPSQDKGATSSPEETFYNKMAANLTAIFHLLQDKYSLIAPHHLFMIDIRGLLWEFPYSGSNLVNDYRVTLIHQSIQSKDMIIILDISLTMSGQPIELARSSAKYLINQLGPNDRFNVLIVGPGTEFVMCQGSLVRASQANKQLAVQLVEGLKERIVVAQFREGLTEAFLALNGSTGCSKTIVVLTAGTLDVVTRVFDEHNADRSVVVFAYLLGPPVEVLSVREMGCYNNHGYYDNIISIEEIQDKLLSVPRVLSRSLAAQVMGGEPCHYHCSISGGGACSKSLIFHLPIFGDVEVPFNGFEITTSSVCIVGLPYRVHTR
jgi:hypothetical protein